MKRLLNETFEDFKERRAKANNSIEDYLKGQVVKPMPSVPKKVKMYKKLEEKFKEAPKLIKCKIISKASKLEDELRKDKLIK